LQLLVAVAVVVLQLLQQVAARVVAADNKIRLALEHQVKEMLVVVQ
jgi:hypothetical protein